MKIGVKWGYLDAGSIFFYCKGSIKSKSENKSKKSGKFCCFHAMKS